MNRIINVYVYLRRCKAPSQRIINQSQTQTASYLLACSSGSFASCRSPSWKNLVDRFFRHTFLRHLQIFLPSFSIHRRSPATHHQSFRTNYGNFGKLERNESFPEVHRTTPKLILLFQHPSFVFPTIFFVRSASFFLLLVNSIHQESYHSTSALAHLIHRHIHPGIVGSN